MIEQLTTASTRTGNSATLHCQPFMRGVRRPPSTLLGRIALPIDRLDFDNLSENDLTELIVGQVPEGLRIDYKRDLCGNSDATNTGC